MPTRTIELGVKSYISDDMNKDMEDKPLTEKDWREKLIWQPTESEGAAWVQYAQEKFLAPLQQRECEVDIETLTATQSEIELLKYNLVRYEGYRAAERVTVFKGKFGGFFVVDGHTRARVLWDIGRKSVVACLCTSNAPEICEELSRVAAEVGGGKARKVWEIPITDRLGQGSAAWRQRRVELLEKLEKASLSVHIGLEPGMSMPRLTVLLVEDDAPVREALARSLVERGHDVIQAGNEQQAIALMSKHDPDVLLTDVNLTLDPPGASSGGLEVLREFRKRFPKRTALAFSQWHDVRGILRCYECGANAFLPKSAAFLPVLTAQLRLEAAKLKR